MTAVMEPEVGKARLRKEDARLITGRTQWTDNISLPGMLHLAILRSPVAHARISRIDVSGALLRPGVITAFTGADLGDRQVGLPCAWPVTEDMVHPDHLPLAKETVRHAGEPVAVVVARDAASAVDALEAIEVEYEALPVVLDMEAALAEGAQLVHSDKGTNK
jgi:carbon-monoxide dehydrogenase large subunit